MRSLLRRDTELPVDDECLLKDAQQLNLLVVGSVYDVHRAGMIEGSSVRLRRFPGRWVCVWPAPMPRDACSIVTAFHPSST